MTPLDLQILNGKADNSLLRIIEDLERINTKRDGGSGLSCGESLTLKRAYERLDILTSH